MDTLSGAGGSTCQAWQYDTGTTTETAIGNTFGTNYSGSAHQESKLGNQIIQFQGDLFAVTFDGIYKKDDPTLITGNWTSQLSFTTPNTSGPSGAGLHVVQRNGVSNLITVWADETDTDGARWARYDGSSWTQATTTQDQGSTWVQTYDSIVYRNVLHVAVSGGATPHFFTYNPVTDAITQAAGSFNNNAYASFCVFQDRLFVCAASSQNVNSIYEYTGRWVRNTSLDVSIKFDTYDQGTVSLYTDGTNMYRLCAAPTDGWRCYQIDGSLMQTDISATVLPSGFRANADGGTWTSGQGTIGGSSIDLKRFSAVYDTNTTPGSLTIYLYYASNGNSGTAFEVWQWNGNSSLITQTDSAAGDVEHAIPKNYANDGERIWGAGDLDIAITAREQVSGGEEITFIAYGGGTGRNMKLWYSVDGEPVLLEATLTTPVSGGSATFNAGMNRVEGIAADGTTEYTIVWDTATDGITSGQRVKRVPEIFA